MLMIERTFLMPTQSSSNNNEIPAAAPVEKPVRPVSEARLHANRINAQKSTGPRTEEGKQRSRLNATRHGLTGQVLCLPSGELDALNAIIRQFEQHYQPTGPQEQHLVHMLAQLQYRLHSIMAGTHNLFAIGIAENSDLWNVNHPAAQTAFVFAETVRRSKDPLLTLSIYEQRLMRQYEKTLKMLRELQTERRTQEADEQEELYKVAVCHLVTGKEFSPSEFGFVYSNAESDALVKRKWTLEKAREAHKKGFDRESCQPVLAFTA
jgi:hypothetical protein